MAKTSAEIRAQIGVFSTNRDQLRDLAHSILMDILVHAAPTGCHVDAGGSGDATLALVMLKEMPKSWAEQARVWFDSFSPIRAIPQRDKCGLDQKYKDLAKIENEDDRQAARSAWWKMEDAQNTPFFKVAEEPDVKMYGADFLNGIFDAQIKVIEGKLEKNTIKPDAIPLALTTIEKLKMAKVLVVAPALPENDDKAAEDKAPVEDAVVKSKKAAA